MHFKVFILTVWLSVVLTKKPVIKTPACKSLPLVKNLDYPKLTSFSPFSCYQTNDLHNFKCGQAMLVGPAAGFSNYTGTFTLINGSHVYTIDYVYKDGVFNDVFCSNGVKAPYRLVYLNLDSSEGAGYCVTVCDEKNGIAFKSFLCVGRGKQAYNNFQKFIEEDMPGVPDIVNANSNCEKPQHCPFFVN